MSGQVVANHGEKPAGAATPNLQYLNMFIPQCRTAETSKGRSFDRSLKSFTEHYRSAFQFEL